jgi:hypothetical protein
MNPVNELPTRIVNSFYGWTAQTLRTENNVSYQITTQKRYSGELTTSATVVNAESDGSVLITSFSFDDTNKFSVRHGKVKCTEKTVKDCHFMALAQFDEWVKTAEAPKSEPVPQIGDILWLDGYGKGKGSEGNNWIVYAIEGKNYKCIEKDTLELRTKDYVKPYSKKYGIGTYFESGYNMTRLGIDENKLADMLIEAQEVEKQRLQERMRTEAEAAKKAEEKQKYLSQFERADRRKTTNIIKQVIIEKWPSVQKVEIKTDVFSMGDSMDLNYYASAKIDELEKFVNSFQYGHFNSMEDIYENYTNKAEIIIKGFILETYKYVSCRFVKVEPKPEVKQEPKPEVIKESGNIQIIDYSPKAIAVIGDTKPIKDTLKDLGGRFNFRLTCGAGWIFPKTKLSEVKQALNL